MTREPEPAAVPEAALATEAAAPVAFDAGRYAAWLVAPFAAVLLFAKVHKLLATEGGDLGSALAALFPDVAFVVVFGVLTWGALRSSRGSLRMALRVALHVVTLALTALVFIEHGFWLTTGTLLDPYTLGYGLEHIGPLGKVYLSEMGPVVWLGLATLLGVHWLPIAAARASRRRGAAAIKDAASAAPALSALSLAGLLAIAPACTGVVALAARVAPPVEPLTDNVVVEFATEALLPPSEPADDASAGALAIEEVALGTGPRAVPDGPPPNVIVIVMESLRARSITPYDPTLDTTPFLASLAARGATADTAWTAVTHTSKAIVGALCGVYPKLDVPIEEAEPTGLPTPCLARILRQRGYDTAFMQTATAHFERRDQLVENMDYETFLSKETIAQRDFEETSYFGWEDEALLQPALDWIGPRAKSGKPFFLTLLTLSTHHTYGTPSDFPKKKRASGELDDYLNAVSYLDGVLEKLFAGLEEQGALDRTLVVLAGDHGEGFGEHGRRQHDSVIYEEGLHVPLMLIGPGVAPGSRIGGLRHLVDIAPTVLEWLGTPVTSGLPGKSLLTSDGHPFLFGSCWLRQRCMATRDATHKYIWHFDKQAAELFDLTADPLEREDLLPETAEATWAPMKERLLAWRADNHARWASFFSHAAKELITTLPPVPSRELDLQFSTPPTDTTLARPLVRLVGLDAPVTRVMSGDPIPVTLHWEVVSPLGTWQPFTHLIGVSPGARPRYNADHVPLGGRHPTAAWQPGTFVSDEFRIQPSQNLPPGTYELVVGFWDSAATVAGVAGRALITPLSEGPSVIDEDRRAHLVAIEVLPAPPSTRKHAATSH